MSGDKEAAPPAQYDSGMPDGRSLNIAFYCTSAVSSDSIQGSKYSHNTTRDSSTGVYGNVGRAPFLGRETSEHRVEMPYIAC